MTIFSTHHDPPERRVVPLIPPSDGRTTAAVCAQSRPLCTDSLLESLKPYAESRPDGVPASSAASGASQCPPFNPHTMEIYVKAPVYRLTGLSHEISLRTLHVFRPSFVCLHSWDDRRPPLSPFSSALFRKRPSCPLC